MPRLAAATALLLLLGPSVGHADEDGDARHTIELAVGGGLSWLTPAPDRFDVVLGGQLSARAMLELDIVRVEGQLVMPDASRPDRAQLRASGRLLFLTVHDVTWRRTSKNELFRLMAGFGGEVDLPEQIGQLQLGVGFAMLHLGGVDGVDQPRSEAYGAYAGLTARLRFWELRDELRFAVHGMMTPPGAAPVTGVGDLFAGFAGGVTASNRLYVQALREGSFSVGPELYVQFEQLMEGPVVLATLGISGTLGL